MTRRFLTLFIAILLSVAGAQAVLNETQKLTASDGAAYDHFGHSAAIAEDAAIVGAYGGDDNGTDSGSAYIFSYNGTEWTEAQKLTASDGVADDLFGYSVAISEDTVIVGAVHDDDNGSDSGSAYIFTFDGTEWVQMQKLTASDGATFDGFGYSVSIDGDTAIVGTVGDDDNGSLSGSAYIFTFDGTEWTEAQKLTASDGAAEDEFGYSVAIAGGTVIVGAEQDDDNGNYSGSAYIFAFDGTEWVQTQKLTASDGATFDRFGYSVSIDGDTAIVGAYGGDDNGTDSGSAYIFTFDGTEWVQTQKLTASDGAASDYFGISVAIAGNTTIVGAVSDDDNGFSSGSAYIFTFDGTEWTEAQKLTASDGAAEDEFGYSVAIAGGTAIVGASWDQDSGFQSGSAYTFAFNQAPVADAGGPYVELASVYGGVVALDGLASYDPDGDALTYEWDLNLAFDSDNDGDPANDIDETAATVEYIFPLGHTDIALVVRDDNGVASEPDMTSVTINFIEVMIDIKPDTYPNEMKLAAKGRCPVAILTDEVFDAADVDPDSVLFAGAAPVHDALKDVDDDGDLDLILHFNRQDLNLTPETEEVLLIGSTFDGFLVLGIDDVVCK